MIFRILICSPFLLLLVIMVVSLIGGTGPGDPTEPF